jgi:hypothetical protein
MRNQIIYASHKAFLTFDNYAASCYDNIILDLASLVIGQKDAIHHSTVAPKAHTVQEAIF